MTPDTEKLLDRLPRTLGLIEDKRRYLDGLAATLSQLSSDRTALEASFDDHSILMESTSRLITSSHEEAIVALEEMLNYGVATVYKRDIRIKVIEETRSNRPILRIAILDGNNVPIDPSRQHGGGLSQILGALTRVLLITATGKRRLMILDEPFSAVSDDLLDDLAQLLRDLVDSLNFQVLLVTHQRALGALADLSYELIAPGEICTIETEITE